MSTRSSSSAAPPAAIHTVGHGERETADLVATLQAFGINAVVDVRSHPGSRRFPRFGREALAAALAQVGIEYRWLGRPLGGQRRASSAADARHPALPSSGLRAFAAWMESDRFAAGIREVEQLASDGAPALLCAEHDAARCHRWLIADYVVAVRGLAVHHLSGPGEPPREHRVSDSARCEHDVLRYDRGTTTTLDLGDPAE